MDAEAFFGSSVTIEGDRVLIGSPEEGEPGKVYEYRGIQLVDCNDNGEPDGCDIALGVSEDVNDNGIPDECECLSDVTGDGTVNVLDLLAVFAAWGASGGDIPEDVNFDGIVDVMDLLLVLSSWGPC